MLYALFNLYARFHLSFVLFFFPQAFRHRAVLKTIMINFFFSYRFAIYRARRTQRRRVDPEHNYACFYRFSYASTRESLDFIRVHYYDQKLCKYSKYFYRF